MKPGTMTLSLCDIAGREIVQIQSGWQSAGAHEMLWTPHQLASGIYILKLIQGPTQNSTKVLYLK
jgi:hypothetical protein